MKIFENSKVTVPVILLLLLMNTAMVVFILMHRPDPSRDIHVGPHPSPPPGPAGFIKKELQLNDHQMKQFDSLISIHRKQMHEHRIKQQHLRDSLFARLNYTDSVSAQYADIIGKSNAMQELDTYRHFQALRCILNEQQQTQLDQLILEIIHSMGGPQRPQGPPPPGEVPLPPHP